MNAMNEIKNANEMNNVTKTTKIKIYNKNFVKSCTYRQYFILAPILSNDTLV